MPAMRESTRPLGVVYTPPAVVAPMVQLALAPLVTGRSAAELLALRVCDPAIGEGAFLVEVISVIAGSLVAAWERGDASAPSDPRTWREEARRQVALACVAGVDIDHRAVEAARLATGAPPSVLRVSNALSLDWEGAFPDVFARGGFDAVVANPPYIRQEQLADKATLQRFASYDGVADLYVYFVELAHQLLRRDGRYCVIVPSKWLTAAYGRPLRTFLAERTSVDGVADLARAPLFADADAFACVVWGTNTGGRDTPVRALRASTLDALIATIATRPEVESAERVSLALPPSVPVVARPRRGDAPQLETGELVPRGRWGAGAWHLDGRSERSFLERIEAAFPALSARISARPARGVVTGCNRAFVIDGSTRARILDEDPGAGSLIRPFVKGRDIRPWRVQRAERYILLLDRGTDLEAIPSVAAHLAPFRAALEPRPAEHAGPWSGRKPGAYAWHELQDPVGPLVKARAPRLLYQDIQTSPACALDDGDVVPDTTVWMLPTDDRFVLAVLNSPLYGWYAQRRFPPALNGAVRPKLAYLAALPIPTLPADAMRAITSLVDRRLAQPLAPHLDAEIAAFVLDAYELSAGERALLAG